MAKEKNDTYEVIKVISALGLGFETGSVLKNLVAAQNTENGDQELEKLKKAQFYLSARISNIETERKRAGWRKVKKTARKKKPATAGATAEQEA